MLFYDFLVIGSGIGGLGFALKAAEKGTVAIICKANADFTNTNLAQGGISAVTDLADSTAEHVNDTLLAGAGLCNEKIVKLVADEAPDCINELQEYGVNFTRDQYGNLDLGREGGHRRNRIVHTHDFTGSSIQQALLQAVKKQPNITLFENHFAIDLLLAENTEGKKRCIGAKILRVKTNEVVAIKAKAVMLATGGIGQVYQHTTNPKVATGDGLTMAFRAGAAVKDMEFVQFHPTALYDPGKPTFLISEAVRGYGAELKKPDGSRFMEKYHPLKSLAPRDVVARAIHWEMQLAGSGFVYLDLRHLPANEIKTRFPKIYQRCLESDLDITTDLIPVVPAAHYSCGGVVTDENGCTSITNLYACGEVACTGLHGANRLASNSLPEAWIFARRAAEHALTNVADLSSGDSEFTLSEIIVNQQDIGPALLQEIQQKVKQLMWKHAGIVRTETGLKTCYDHLLSLQKSVELKSSFAAYSVELLETKNMIQTALLITISALNRKQSCGCHYLDHSKQNKKTTVKKTAKKAAFYKVKTLTV